MAETEGSDDTSENELLNTSLSVWKGNKEQFEPIPLDLHTAASLGLYECVKILLIRGGVDIDKRNKGSWTALMYACYIGHDSIVSLLLEQGACVNIRNQKKETSLMLAASCGNDRVGFLLCSHGAELESQDERGWTALFHATYSGHQNMVRFLLEQGANINAIEPSMGMTPFMEAAAEGHEIILQLFLQHGVNVNARAYNGDTARSLALINSNMKIVSLIDNHVMPITSLRAEPDLNSSDDMLLRNRRTGRVKSIGGEPSITDGPQAIARLIDRTRDTPASKAEVAVAPKGYMSFPDEDDSATKPQKISYRDVTAPINPEDYKLDSSSGREYNEVEDDSNAFSKTGALTIKSSSGSSGGLAAVFGIIRREDSLDSDEFPHESSCGESHHHDNSCDSSSEDGIDENVESHNKLQETLAKKSNLSDKNASRTTKSKDSKDILTTEKVKEIEVMKNSVLEWIDGVKDPHPVPENNFESPSKELLNAFEEQEKHAALKPEYQPKSKVLKSRGNHSVYLSDNMHTQSSQHEPDHISGLDLIEQVANSLKNYDRRPGKDLIHPKQIIGNSTNSSEHNITSYPVSALDILNTAGDGYISLPSSHSPTENNAGSQSGSSYHGNQGSIPPPPPGFSHQIPPYQIFSNPGPPVVSLYSRDTAVVNSSRIPGQSNGQAESKISSNAAFLEKMKDTPWDLMELLEQLGLGKYFPTFEEQDVDLQVFLSLNDNDLKEIGVKLFGPRKKMMNAIARWHSKARLAVGELEQAYADRLGGEMQEMGVQLQMAVEQLEKLKAQVKQEQHLRSVTEACLMEERGAWQNVQRIVADTRQQCEEFKDTVRKMNQYLHELKVRIPPELLHSMVNQKRIIRESSAIKDDKKSVISYEQMSTESIIGKLDHYMQDIQHLLANVTINTDRLLGRNSLAESPERSYS